MRILSFIFVVLLAVSVSAQKPEIEHGFNEAARLASAKNYEKALQGYRNTLRIAQNEPDEFRAKLHFNTGVCLYQMQRQAEAVAEYEQAVKLNPNYEKAFYALGMANFELRNFESAEKAFIKALEINRKNGETWFDLAFVYLARNDYAAAKAAFQNSIKFKSVAADISHNNLGVILALAGDVNGAVREFETALEKSGGKLREASRNLEFCRSLGQNFKVNLTAKLEFGK